VYGEVVATATTWSGTQEACLRFNSISVSVRASAAGTLNFYTGFSGALVLEAVVPVLAGANARLVLPVSYTAYRVDVVNDAGGDNTISVETLMHMTGLTPSWPAGSTGLMIDTALHGEEGNLFSAVAVAAAGTDSTEVDVSQMSTALICVAGSSLVATLPFDIMVSHDATRWYQRAQLYTTAIDGNGDPATERTGSMELSLTGVSWLKLVAHETETVNASILG